MKTFFQTATMACATLLFFSSLALGLELGWDQSAGYVGAGTSYHLSNASGQVASDREFIPGADARSATTYTNVDYDVQYSGDAQLYDLHGYLGSGDTDYDSFGGLTFFYNEVQLITANGDAATLEFNFNLDVSIDGTLGSEDNFGVYWGYLEGFTDGTEYNGAPVGMPKVFWDMDPFDEHIFTASTSTTISLSMGGDTVRSGAYLPFVVVANGYIEETHNVTYDWLNTFTLDQDNPVNVYQDGTLLSTDQYSLTGTAFPSQAPIPEPSTLLLLGSGLAGLAWHRRQRKNA